MPAKKSSAPAKKTAPKSSPGKGGAPAENESPDAPDADADETDDAEPQFVASQLAAELGAPDPALLAAFLHETPDADLVNRGTQISSPRVVTDGVRMFGIAWTFYKGATAAQKKTLRGCSQELLALGVAEVLRLERMVEQQAAQRQHEGSVREVSAVAENTAWDTSMSLRGQAEDALRGAAGSPEARAAVNKAVGTAETSDALARGLEALARLLEQWLAQAAGSTEPNKALKQRLAMFALDADYAKELQTAANTLRKTSATAKNRVQTSRINKVQLDRQDGVCLLLLDAAIRAFEYAHALDPTIPRLIPIATRSVLARKRNSKKPPAPASTPTSTPT